MNDLADQSRSSAGPEQTALRPSVPKYQYYLLPILTGLSALLFLPLIIRTVLKAFGVSSVAGLNPGLFNVTLVAISTGLGIVIFTARILCTRISSQSSLTRKIVVGGVGVIVTVTAMVGTITISNRSGILNQKILAMAGKYYYHVSFDFEGSEVELTRGSHNGMPSATDVGGMVSYFDIKAEGNNDSIDIEIWKGQPKSSFVRYRIGDNAVWEGNCEFLVVSGGGERSLLRAEGDSCRSLNKNASVPTNIDVVVPITGVGYSII
jgi:hypothetical protein